jgi:hypothetical protein
MARDLHQFFSTMRSVCQMERVSDLRGEAPWNEFAAKTQVSRLQGKQLSWYSSVSTKYYPQFRSRLEVVNAPLARQDLFPPHARWLSQTCWQHVRVELRQRAPPAAAA